MTRPKSIQEVEGGWDTDRPTNVSAHSNDASPDAYVGTFAAGRPTARPVLVARVDSAATNIVNSLTDHETLRDRCLDVKNSAGLAEKCCQGGIFLVVFTNPCNIAHGRFEALETF
jgi:hypothetical protein